MPYVPPLTLKGLHDRIEKFMIEEKQEKFLERIKSKKDYHAIWNMAIQMSFLYMGGKDNEGLKRSKV